MLRIRFPSQGNASLQCSLEASLNLEAGCLLEALHSHYSPPHNIGYRQARLHDAISHNQYWQLDTSHHGALPGFSGCKPNKAITFVGKFRGL